MVAAEFQVDILKRGCHTEELDVFRNIIYIMYPRETGSKIVAQCSGFCKHNCDLSGSIKGSDIL
jgi:hypothetical protein